MTELDLGRLAHRAGLGSPRRQVLRRARDGRARYVDAEFDLPDGAVLSVEVDGAGHLDAENWRSDLARQNELIIDGALLLRFDSVTVRLEPERVVTALRRVRATHRRPPR